MWSARSSEVVSSQLRYVVTVPVVVLAQATARPLSETELSSRLQLIAASLKAAS